MESDEGVLVVKRIHVTYLLRASRDALPAIERAHRFYAMRCPIYRTLHTAIAITTEVQLVETED